LGANYDLLSNSQWQAIARNIESVASNWSNGSSAGSNSLNRGNSNQSAALESSATDTHGCVGITSNGDPADNCGNTWHVNKRTHTLSNGQIIWDIAGNVHEWVTGSPLTVGQYVDGYISVLTTAEQHRWGPAGNYSSKVDGEYGGLGFGYFESFYGIPMRGGSWIDGNRSGIFSAASLPLTFFGGEVGFRCVTTGS
jgi:hypothetical protein